MATTRGPVSTEVDSPLAQSGNPTPGKLLTDGQGFRPLGLAAATPGSVAVDTTMSLGPARSTSQAHNHVPHQLSPLQHLGGQTTIGHFPGSHTVTLHSHLSSPHLSAQRPQQPQQHIVGGAPRQHPHHPVQMASTGPAAKISRSQVEIRRRTPQEGQMEISRVHPIVSRPVANMGQPMQGSLGGNQLGKPQGLMLHHRPQASSPQEKLAHVQKPTAAAQRQALQKAHARTAGWQTPLGPQHTPGTPSRMFHPHPVLNSQARSSPQEQNRQHPALPQQFSQQPQLRDVGPAGIKSLPMYPALRTPVAGNHTSNHNDTAYRERLSDSPIVVPIGDRKVRLVSELDPSSLYSLCRRWMRNDIPRPDRTGVRDVMNITLPRPLSVAEVENAGDYTLDNGSISGNEPEMEKSVDSMTDKDLLLSHIQHFKTVRKRSKVERMRKIARFKLRLAELLPGNESGTVTLERERCTMSGEVHIYYYHNVIHIYNDAMHIHHMWCSPLTVWIRQCAADIELEQS